MHASALADMDKLLDAAPSWTKRCLDVGSLDENGTTRPLTDARGWQCTGVDIREGKNVDLVVQPYNYPFEDGAFDVVMSSQAMEHVEDLRAWINECVRVLAPGGRLCITTVWKMFEHRYPIDTWRIMPDGMRWLFEQNAQLTDYDIRITTDEGHGGNIVGAATKKGDPRPSSDRVIVQHKHQEDINMRLDEALHQVALAADLPAEDLIRYAAEDKIGGRDTGQWSAMSTFADEGKVIYALVRALRPAQVVEIGVASGGTSTHILSALAANDYGHLWSADIAADCGLNVPEHLRSRWTFTVGDALTMDLPERADFVFEDGAHSYEFTSTVLVRLKALNPRVIMSHDFFTHEVYGGFDVKRAFDDVLPGGFGLKLDNCFTGLGVWVNKDYFYSQGGSIEVRVVPKAEHIREILEEATAGSMNLPIKTEEGPIIELEPKPKATRKKKAARK